MSRLRGDQGAYAILYAMLLVLLIGITSVVIDLGMMRMDRRANRAAADSAAIAGASKLGLSGLKPFEACVAAVNYARADLGMSSVPVTDASLNDCRAKFAHTGFNAATVCAAGVARTAVVPLPGGRTLHVTWPVPNNSPLMTDPDHERNRSYDLPDQGTSVAQDGTRCLRVGVAITQDRTTPFAAVWGDIDATRGTVSHSVGVAAPDDGPGDIAAPLVVLDEHSCDALLVTGGGSVTVKASTLVNGISTPGVIAIDSDGDGTGEVACNGQSKTIKAPSSVNHIWAVDGTAGPAYISSYAMAVGNAVKAYDTAAIANCTPGKSASEATLQASPQAALCPVPIAGSRIGEEPWIARYNCQEGVMSCPSPNPAAPLPSPRNYVDQWKAFAENTSASSARATWGTAPGTNRISGGACDHNAAGTVVTGDTFVDCPQFHVANGGSIDFHGRVIFSGNVDAAAGGCIRFNPDAYTSCTTPTYAAIADRGPDGGNIYVGGSVTGNGNGFYAGALIINQAFMYVAGRVNINTSDPVFWTAPYGKQLTHLTPVPSCVPADLAQPATTAPTPACFDSLGLWAPTFGTDQPTQANRLRGGALLVVDGTLFMPKSYFTFAGQGANFQDRAQFVARRLEIAGGGELSMVPDGSRSTLIPRGVGKLIR